MKLTKVRVKLYRNIVNSTEVLIQEDVTALVGKNESGKTAFLNALCRLNPAIENVSLSILEDYPAWLQKKHELQGDNLQEVKAVEAVFQLEDKDKQHLEMRFGNKCLSSNEITLTRTYNWGLTCSFEYSEQHIVKYVISSVEISKNVLTKLKHILTFKDLTLLLSELEANETDAEDITRLKEAVNKVTGDSLHDTIERTIKSLIPKFFYFAEYSALPSSIKIKELLNADKNKLTNDLQTALSLLKLAASVDDYLLNPNYEKRKRELENVSNAIRDEVLTYWTQNPELEVLIDITKEQTRNAQGQPEAVLDELKVRIRDTRHSLSLPLHEHSTGFRWFFSFLTAFSEYERSQQPFIILLDEPALGLHARAQKDFLKFIDERLATKHQVIYTTHSPFMVQQLERVRIVEDKGRDLGSQITSDILTSDPDTLFPLQAALGYDLVQHLFISPNNLIVEGTSDFAYMQTLSDFLKETGRIGLDEKWSLVPVGGADQIPTFVALLGRHLDITVVIDSRKEGNQRLTKLADDGYLAHKRIITIGSILGSKAADIEDLFAVDDYLNLYNKTFGKKVKSSEIQGSDGIVSQIARFEGVVRFEHGKVGNYFLREQSKILPTLDVKTLDQFEKLFTAINATLSNT